MTVMALLGPIPAAQTAHSVGRRRLPLKHDVQIILRPILPLPEILIRTLFQEVSWISNQFWRGTCRSFLFSKTIWKVYAIDGSLVIVASIEIFRKSIHHSV
jgi:hypothetical protein